MNIQNNKGQLSQVMILILILVSAIVILLVITRYVTKSTMDESVSACRISVMTQAATAWGIISKTSPLDINCDKRYVNFYNTRAELGLSLENMNSINVDLGDHKAKKFSELNDFIVDQVVAEELRVCKFEFGDGEINIFPNDKSGIFTGKDVCFVCSEINFKSITPSKTFIGLIDYTKKTTFSDAGTSYFNYLTEPTLYNESMWDQGAYIDEHPKDYTISLDSSQSYSVVVRKHVPVAAGTKIIVSSIPIIGGPVSSMITSTESIDIGIVQTKNLNKYCNLQAS